MPQKEKPSQKNISFSRPHWTAHPTIRFFAGALLILAIYWGYGFVTGPGRMTDRLNARLAENPTELNIAITSRFPPEEFHISIYQRVGSMRGVEESTAYLHSMTPGDVRYLSQYYWVDNIDLIPDKK